MIVKFGRSNGIRSTIFPLMRYIYIEKRALGAEFPFSRTFDLLNFYRDENIIPKESRVDSYTKRRHRSE